MPSETQNAFMDRMRQMMFRPIRNQAPEPVRPDYNESPSADEAIQIRVDADYSPFLFQNVNMAEIETRQIQFEMPEINWQRIAEQVQRGEARLGRGNDRESVDHAFNAWWYAQQAPQSARDRARERTMRALQGTTWHPSPHRGIEQIWDVIDEPITPADGLYEIPGVTHVRKVKEAGVVYKGVRAIVLPVISLKSGFVEYSKGSPEPENGTQRVEFEKYAMERIIEWGKKNTQAFK